MGGQLHEFVEKLLWRRVEQLCCSQCLQARRFDFILWIQMMADSTRCFKLSTRREVDMTPAIYPFG